MDNISECTHGYFGFNCIQFCGNCYNNSCNKLNGSCEAGCKGGFSGSVCTIKGKEGYFYTSYVLKNQWVNNGKTTT